MSHIHSLYFNLDKKPWLDQRTNHAYFEFHCFWRSFNEGKVKCFKSRRPKGKWKIIEWISGSSCVGEKFVQHKGWKRNEKVNKWGNRAPKALILLVVIVQVLDSRTPRKVFPVALLDVNKWFQNVVLKWTLTYLVPNKTSLARYVEGIFAYGICPAELPFYFCSSSNALIIRCLCWR